jgi:cephalosporin-C deacetylase-like acetyl esterase
MRAICSAVCWVLLVPAGVAGQQDAVRRHERFIAHLKKTAAQLSARSLSDIHTLADWQARRPTLRRELLYMLGLDPLPARTPLRARVTRTLERTAYRVEKLLYQSLPGLYVTGNLYLPRQPAPPLPAILYVCGHSPHPLGAKWSYQDRAVWFAEHGYVCLVLDTLEFGEVPGLHHGVHDLNLWNWLSLGYTPAGVEVWNAMRGLDFLESRPEVDRTRIGMTGISGGGAVTWFTAAVDERIAAAVPVCSTYTFGSQAAHWVASGQCDCIYFHNTFLEDFPIVGALIAPRPLCICSGQKDPDFPPDGYHEVFRRVKRIYDLYPGASGCIREVDDNVGHSDVPRFRTEARQWMNRWLKGSSAPLALDSTAEAQPESAETLACLTQLPADAVNDRIHDSFIPVAHAGQWTTLPAWLARRRELVQELRDKVFRWFPRERPPFAARVGRDTGGWAARYADCKEVFFDTEPDVPIRARLFMPRKRTPEAPLLLYIKRPIDSIHPLDLDDLLPVLGRIPVLVLNPRLTEHPVTPFELAEIERSASWIGRTVAAMQVWDILRAIEWAYREEKLSVSGVAVYGKGEMGILGLYAALFDDRIQQVLLKDPPDSHRQGPALLNVLRVTDIPEVAAALAPRKLVVLGKLPASFAWAQAIYRLHGQPASLMSAASMPQALEVWKY